jgi:hypothetical protein
MGRRAYRRPTDAERRAVGFFQSGQKKPATSTKESERAGVDIGESTIPSGSSTIRRPWLLKFLQGQRSGTCHALFFIWSIPDDLLLNLAIQGRLKNPTVLEQQVAVCRRRARTRWARTSRPMAVSAKNRAPNPDEDVFPT